MVTTATDQLFHVLSAVGAVGAITPFDLGPAWYPLLLVAVALPSVWLGGAPCRHRLVT